MRRHSHNPAATTALLAFLVFLVGGVLLVLAGLGLFALREVEYRRDRERFDQLDRAVGTEIRIGDSDSRPRANAALAEQNAILRKWPGRFPGRVEQRLLGTVP